MATAKEENWVPKNLADFKFKPRDNRGFDSAKYESKNHSYPADLMSNPQYGGNYAIFYINVSVDSKLITEDKAATVNVADVLPRDRGDLIAQNFSKTGIGAAAGAAAGLAAGGGLGALTGGASGGVKGLAKGAALGAAAGGALTSDYGIGTLAADATRSQKRLKTAIALHIPNNLSVRYGVNYESEDTAGVAMMGAGADEIAKAMSSQGKMSDLKEPAKAIVANIALSKGPNAGAVSAAMGLAANPKKEQVFKGVDFRSFQFEYQFFPRNSAEAKNVLNIVHEFKYHMHPEFKDSNNFIYIYPSEFDIFYYSGGKENTSIHKHTSCVLTEMNINYTPNGQFTTFADGMPTQINIQLSFRELALLTKDKIKGGL